MRPQIEEAIRHKKLLQVDYKGGTRIIEPHLLAVQGGRIGVMSFQLEGYSSSGGLPEWRRIYLDEMVNLVVLSRKFAGRRPFPSGRHSSWDQVLLVVEE
jgi:hypothetical protein